MVPMAGQRLSTFIVRHRLPYPVGLGTDGTVSEEQLDSILDRIFGAADEGASGSRSKGRPGD